MSNNNANGEIGENKTLIVFFGTVCKDIKTHLKNEQINNLTARFPQINFNFNSKTLVSAAQRSQIKEWLVDNCELEQAAGGTACNAAIDVLSLYKNKTEVWLVSNLCKDEFNKQFSDNQLDIVSVLEERGISEDSGTFYCTLTNEPTHLSIVLNNEQGRAVISSDEPSARTVPSDTDKLPDIQSIASRDSLVIVEAGYLLNNIKYFRNLSGAGVPIVVSLQGFNEVNKWSSNDTPEHNKKQVLLNFINANAFAIDGDDKEVDAFNSALKNNRLSNNIPLVVKTLGKEGVIITRKQTEYTRKQTEYTRKQTEYTIKAKEIKNVVSALGAGDMFLAALFSMILNAAAKIRNSSIGNRKDNLLQAMNIFNGYHLVKFCIEAAEMCGYVLKQEGAWLPKGQDVTPPQPFGNNISHTPTTSNNLQHPQPHP